jgi:hypothetical protein
MSFRDTYGDNADKKLGGRDILITAAASSSDWIDSRSSLNIMISVSNVSMR